MPRSSVSSTARRASLPTLWQVGQTGWLRHPRRRGARDQLGAPPSLPARTRRMLRARAWRRHATMPGHGVPRGHAMAQGIVARPRPSSRTPRESSKYRRSLSPWSPHDLPLYPSVSPISPNLLADPLESHLPSAQFLDRHGRITLRPGSHARGAREHCRTHGINSGQKVVLFEGPAVEIRHKSDLAITVSTCKFEPSLLSSNLLQYTPPPPQRR